MIGSVFFFNDTATTEIYTLSLHDALPIYPTAPAPCAPTRTTPGSTRTVIGKDRKSTRLNSSHQIISYAVFCLKKKNTITGTAPHPPSSATQHPPHPLLTIPTTADTTPIHP